MAQNAADGGVTAAMCWHSCRNLSIRKECAAAGRVLATSRQPRTTAELTKERLRRAASKHSILRSTCMPWPPGLENDAPCATTPRLGFPRLQTRYLQYPRLNPKPDDLEAPTVRTIKITCSKAAAKLMCSTSCCKLGLDPCVPIEQRSIAGRRERRGRWRAVGLPGGGTSTLPRSKPDDGIAAAWQ